MQENSNGNVKYWFNSNNGDYIEFHNNEYKLYYRCKLESYLGDITGRPPLKTSRVISESELNYIILKFGFLPVKLKGVENKMRRMYRNGYEMINYPSKKEIRNLLLDIILKK